MRVPLLIVLLACALLADPGAAGKQEVTRLTINGVTTITTRDTQGDNSRIEAVNPDGSHRVVLFKPKTAYELDPQAQEYVVQRRLVPAARCAPHREIRPPLHSFHIRFELRLS